MVFLGKIMLFRRAIHKLGFQDGECKHVFYETLIAKREEKGKFNDLLLNGTNVLNLATNCHKFHDAYQDGQKKQIEECPPLLDPVVCKDFKKAVELH